MWRRQDKKRQGLLAFEIKNLLGKLVMMSIRRRVTIGVSTRHKQEPEVTLRSTWVEFITHGKLGSETSPQSEWYYSPQTSN